MRKMIFVAAALAAIATAVPAQAAQPWVAARFAHVPMVGSSALGILGIAGALVVNEWISKTTGTNLLEPLGVQAPKSWRDPNWRGPRE